jgi:hypothetical protein
MRVVSSKPQMQPQPMSSSAEQHRAVPEPNIVDNAKPAVREAESRTPAALVVRVWRAFTHAIGTPGRIWRGAIATLRHRTVES